MTIPITIRKALALSAADELLFQLEKDRVVLRKAQPLDIAYLRVIQSSFATEWNSEEDEKAYHDL